MLEVLQNFEEVAVRFSPIVLVAPGSVCVGVGLFVWLGGLGFRRVLAGIVGAVAGGVCGFLLTSGDTTLAGLSAIAGTAIALILEKIFVTDSLFWRFTLALCCAVLGTLLVFAGMVLLLLYKGAMPISYISHKTSFYTAVLLAMIAFGMVEQLLLCQRTKEKLIRKKRSE